MRRSVVDSADPAYNRSTSTTLTFKHIAGFKKIPVVTIEGNIGAGKSTLLKHIQNTLPSTATIIVPEPVDIWTQHGFLQGLYNGTLTPEAFQYVALASIASQMRETMRQITPETKIILAERSLLSTKEVFAKATLKSKISLQAYNFVWQQTVKTLPTLNIRHMYVRTPTATCMERIQTRGRDSESNIAEDYVQKLAELHEEWVERDTSASNQESKEWLIIDGNQPSAEVLAEAIRMILPLIM